MERVYLEVESLDRRAIDRFYLSEDILMENAALSIANLIREKFPKNSSILVVAGSGNNGADGVALARILHREFDISLYLYSSLKSEIGKVQLQRVKALGVKIVDKIVIADIVLEALFGSGLNRELSSEVLELIEKMNQNSRYRVAIDISTPPFRADYTIVMGAFKLKLFEDYMKDYIGELRVANLGISRDNYQVDSNFYLLEREDLKLPYRVKKVTHKGDFGHLAVISGERVGASVISGLSALNFGSGAVTLVQKSYTTISFELMQSKDIPKSANSMVVGMGLGDSFSESEVLEFFKLNLPTVIDADIFHREYILDILNQRENLVLTPHPKEFCSLLRILNIADISVEELQRDRFNYLLKFSILYPKVVLVLKGANTLIAKSNRVYINSFGVNSLSKAGSGDVLAGLIASLLSQGYSSLESAISGSLAHSIAGANLRKNSYALSPKDLIEEICYL